MKTGEYRWDTPTELRTRCKLSLSLRLDSGHQLFTAGKTPLATAVLMPDGKTLDITIRTDRVEALTGRQSRCRKVRIADRIETVEERPSVVKKRKVDRLWTPLCLDGSPCNPNAKLKAYRAAGGKGDPCGGCGG